MHPQRDEITRLLNAWYKGDQDALGL
jgi:hypothetical protein